jgi:hypothetical protein
MRRWPLFSINNMKFVALIDLTKKKPEERIITFMHDEPGPVPPLINPPEPDQPKDMPPAEKEKKS